MDLITQIRKPTIIQIGINKQKLLQKRVFDIIFACILLVISSPVYISIMIIIKLTNLSSPVLFSHWRIGLDGEYFKCIKFRTMVPDAEDILEEWKTKQPDLYKEFIRGYKLEHDPRVVRFVGTILRKTSLDELPQLLNVLKGEMSLVGPRPIVHGEKEKYGVYYDSLVSVRPGITGLWQVSGRSDVSYEERIKMDIEYVHNISLLKDIKIILRTMFIVLKKTGAY